MSERITFKCLHCEIMELVMRRVGVETDNELAFRIIEALAEIVAASPNRTMRREFMASIQHEFERMVAENVARRREAGVAPSRIVTRH